MENLQELLQQRSAAINKMKDVNSTVLAEKRAMNSDEEIKWEKLETHLSSLDNQIEAFQRNKDLEKRQATMAFNKDPQAIVETDEIKYRNAFSKYVTKGERKMTQEESNIMFRSNEMNTTLVDPEGGYLVPQLWAKEIIKPLHQFSPIYKNSRIIHTSTGATLNMVTSNDQDKAQIIGEGQAVATQKLQWGNVKLKSFKYRTKGILISYELFTDSIYNVENDLKVIGGERIGRGINFHFTSGNGTTQPQGIINGTLGTTSAGISRNSILDLIHSVDPAYRASGNFKLSFNDNTLAAIRKLSIGSADDRPLWQPSMIEGEPNKIEGIPYFINPDMPDPESGNICIIAADMSKFAIRKIGNIRLLRSSERFIEHDATVFYFLARYDSRILIPDAVKHMAIA